MFLTKYNEYVVHIFIVHLLKYLDNIENIPFINSKNKNSIILQGYNTLLRILSIIHFIQMSEDQINAYLEKTHMLFIEYTEQVYLKKEEISHSPTMFVYNVLIGNICLNSYLSTIKLPKDEFIIKISKWSNLLLFWNHNDLSLINRKYIVKNFLKSYLFTFIHHDLFHVYRVFETIQTHFLKKSNIFDIYSMNLSSFHNYFIKNEKIFSENEIENLCFEKFYKNKDYFDDTFNNVTTKQDMDKLISWIFE